MKHTVKVIKLKRGSRLLAISVPNSSLAGFGIGVRAGYKYAERNKTEIAHLLEHLMFDGNNEYPNQDDFTYELEKNGTYHNGHTGSIYIDFEYTFAKEFATETIKLALAQLKGPIFNEALIKNEKTIIKKELDPILDDAYEPCSYNLRNEISEDVFTPDERIGSLKNICLNDLRDYYQKYFVAENTSFLLFGDFTEKDIKKYADLLNELLLDYPHGQKQDIIYKKLKSYSKKVIAQNSKRVERNCLDFSFVNPGYPIDDSPAIKVFYAIYNEGTYSRMFRVIRSKGIGYNFRSGYAIGKNYSELYFYDRSGLKDSLSLFNVALRELRDILSGNITEMEFDRAKGYIIGELEKQYSTATDLAHWYVADFADEDSLIDFNNYIQSVRDLTINNVIEAGNNFVVTKDWVLSLLGPNIKKEAPKYKETIQKYFG